MPSKAPQTAGRTQRTSEPRQRPGRPAPSPFPPLPCRFCLLGVSWLIPLSTSCFFEGTVGGRGRGSLLRNKLAANRQNAAHDRKSCKDIKLALLTIIQVFVYTYANRA